LIGFFFHCTYHITEIIHFTNNITKNIMGGLIANVRCLPENLLMERKERKSILYRIAIGVKMRYN
jgi:hypothetical protein